jgi:NAD+ kinase
MVVHVESSILDDANLISNQQFMEIRDKVMVFREGRDDLTDKIDFIICLGGDGTLLYASSLFQVHCTMYINTNVLGSPGIMSS